MIKEEPWQALIFRLVALNESSRFDPPALGELPLFVAAFERIKRIAASR